MLSSTSTPRHSPRFSRPFTAWVLAVLLLTGTSGPALATSGAAPTDDPSANLSCDGQTFVVVEEQPTLIGGMTGLQSSLRYPASARAAGVEGRVFVQFVVDQQGRVLAPRVTRGVQAELDAEALRVIRTARFVPGRQNDRPVCVQMSLPITFRLEGQGAGDPVTGAMNEATGSVQSASSAAATRTTDAANATTNAATSVTETVDGTTAAVDNASTTVTQGVEDTKTSVETAKEDMSAAASSVKSTFRGLVGRSKAEEAPPAETPPAGAHSSATNEADASLAAGDVLTAKVDNIALRAEPSATAEVIAPVRTTDPLVYLGEETAGFLRVQGSSGQGWINKVLVDKQ